MTEYKVILVGDSSTGKTTMSGILRGKKPTEYTPSTIGSEYQKYIPNSWKGTNKTIGIWDTAGQARYANIVQMYFRNCTCILFCIPADANAELIQSEMDNTMKTIRANSSCNTIIYVVVTKCDLIQTPWHLEWIDKWSWKWLTMVKNIFYTSSYDNTDSIFHMFEHISAAIDANCNSVSTIRQINFSNDEYGGVDSYNDGEVINIQHKRNNKCCIIN